MVARVIRVNRSSEPAPGVLTADVARAAYGDAKAHFAADVSAARQQIFKFEPLYRDEEVRAALSRLFRNKCAFCESLLEPAAAAPVTHHFRPKQEAVDANGAVSRPHYWWLAYEWDNLYPACQRCATAAGAQFPVSGDRAQVGTVGPQLRQEKSMLLDPCNDDPDAHLAFHVDGSVSAVTTCGENTISVYALNRRALVEARRAEIAAARDPSRPRKPDRAGAYAGALEQVLGGAGPPGYPTLSRLRLLGRRAWKALTSFVAPLQRVTPGSPSVQRVVIERLEIRDFRGVRHLTLDLAGPDDKAPWTMLLGENGHGKTSVLQALALVLMGEEARGKLDLKPDELIRGDAEAAEIVAHVRGAIEPRTLRVQRKGKTFTVSGDHTPCALAAYGAARIPSTRRRLAFQRISHRPRVENLFDAATPLIDADRWLAGLDDRSFDFAGRALRRLLLEPEDTVVQRRDGRAVLHTPEGDNSLNALSDGYRAMIALAADVMSFFMTRYGSIDAADGVVLVDELGAHLHPRWQMRVVEAFREAFPRLQFVATTHDPLTLRGLADQSEIVVLRRTSAGEVFALPPDEVPPVRGLRVDELLTSEVFGLSSTIDPEIERDFDRYYALLASHDRGPEIEHEIDALKKRLAEHRQFGTTVRERLVLEAADEYLARERDIASSGARGELLDETKQRLRAIWAGEEEP
jgi:uncharacterized protein (TIGR02646 family)